LIVANQPTREFGKRRPVAIPTAPPVKRSNHVALLLMGTFAVGGAAYALMPSENCGQLPGMALDSNAQCPPRGSSSGGGGGSFSSRSSFFGSNDSSDRQSSATSSESASGKVTRGGFGGFAHAFAAHFSGGG
jgi:hypothetical protein